MKMACGGGYNLTPLNTKPESTGVNKGTKVDKVNADVSGEHEYMDLTTRISTHTYDTVKSADANGLHKSCLNHRMRPSALNAQYNYAYGINTHAPEYDYVDKKETEMNRIKLQSQRKRENEESLYHEYCELKPIGGDTDVSASCCTRRKRIISVCVVTSVLVVAVTVICVFIVTASNSSTSTATESKEAFQTSPAVRTTREGTTAIQTTPKKEIVVLDTPNRYKYIPLPDLGKLQAKTNFVFKVKAANDAHVLLHEREHDLVTDIYEIVLGGWSNSRSVIRKRKQGKPLVSVVRRGLLSSTKFRTFWASWDENKIRIGRGPVVGVNIIMQYYDPKSTTVNFVSVCTGWGATGVWQYYV